ncbi:MULTISPECIES: hypothetical protein [Acidithiobacillus]|uniref:Uncharacterized protein n=1 Tax=Acidithiobacillus ferruginosus TaxID=3063951 RepID=A0ACD5IIK9_9PROT|nr:hypothetical protein [Acidithiobacillus ferruginosus]
MRKNPLRQWKCQILTCTGVAILGAAAAASLAYAHPYEGDALASQQSHMSVTHLWIDGHSVPAAAQSRVIHFPGGVMKVQTVTWGSGGSHRQLQVSSENLSPAQAQAMVEHSLWQMQAMEVSMDRQIAQMQRLMRVSFGPFAMPSFRLPVPVALLSLPPEMPFSGAIPRDSLNLGEGSGAAPSVPMTPLSGHQTLQVRWDHPHAPSPKIPL